MDQENQTPHKRRVRYKGKYPKKFEEKYKELQPEKYQDTIQHVIQKGNTPAGMHISIMVQEILDFLQIQPGQVGFDATLGYGGHTKAMLACLKGQGHMYATDVDPEESAKTRKRLEEAGYGEDMLSIRLQNFCTIDEIAKEAGGFDFILADLGVSSMQIDNPKRGFSFKVDGPLDLRLNQEAGISASEFRYREADFGQFPKGLLYGIQCLDSWLYDDMQPFMHVEALDTYRFLREQVETGYFETLIEKYLLHNPHASVVVIEPERGLNAKREETLAEKLAAYKDSLSKEEIKQLIADTKHLKQYQEEPSPKEDLAKIPMLKREDMKREAAPLYNTMKKCGDTTVVHHEMFSNGIDYLRILFDIRDMEIKDLPYVGILKYILGYMDTERYGFSELANEINIHTGGISASCGVYPHVKKPEDMQFMFELRVKTLASELPQAMDLLREIIMTTKISDEKRLSEIIAQLRSRVEAAFDGSGHSVASMRALSYFSRAAYYQEATAGISFYELVADLDEHFNEKKDALIAQLEKMVQTIFVPERMIVSVVCEEADYQAVEAQIAFLLKNLYPSKEIVKERSLPELHLEKKNEGFMDASQVQYVARAGNYVRHGFSYHGALRILKVIMGYDYLWINVRVKGGAYGCMNSYMRNGDTYFVSYRDPNLKKTDEIYDGIPQYLADFKADEREMTKYIIGTISDMDTPMNPSAKGARSMTAYLQGLDFADIQKERDQVIGATDEDIRGLKDLIASVLEEKNLCVIGNEDNLKSQSDMFMQLKNLYE